VVVALTRYGLYFERKLASFSLIFLNFILLLVLILVYRRFKLSRKREYLK